MRPRPLLCAVAFLVLSAGDPACFRPPLDVEFEVYPLHLSAHPLRASTGTAHGSQIHLNWTAQAWRQCNIAVRGGQESDPKTLTDTYHNRLMGDLL